MKVILHSLIIVLVVFVLGCNKENISKQQEIIPPDITYSILDSGKVVFKNTFPDKYQYNWSVNTDEKEAYYTSGKEPYFIFLANGKKNIVVSWTDSFDRNQRKEIDIEIKNAITPKDIAYTEGNWFGQKYIYQTYPMIELFGSLPPYSGIFTINSPKTTIYNYHGTVILVDLNEKPSRSLAEFRKNIKVGIQPLADKPGWYLPMAWFSPDRDNNKNLFFSSGKSNKEKLEILEIKETPLQKLYTGMEANLSLWITWHYTNGEEGDKKIEFTTKTQYYFKE
jgi:hypothetical protein